MDATMARKHPASANDHLRPQAHRQFKRLPAYAVPVIIPGASEWNAAISQRGVA